MPEIREAFEWMEPYIREYKELAGGGKLYKVRAIHVTTTQDLSKFSDEELGKAGHARWEQSLLVKKRYTHDELLRGGRSLSDRPIGINHKLRLPWPQNSTLDAEYSGKDRFVETIVRVYDKKLIELIDQHKVKHVSIEGHSRGANEVDGIEPLGVVFTGLTFVTEDEIPGDPATSIEVLETIRLEEITDFGEPFAGYKDFADCVAKNADQKNPQAYCAAIMRQAETSQAVTDGKTNEKIGENKNMSEQVKEPPTTNPPPQTPQVMEPPLPNHVAIQQMTQVDADTGKLLNPPPEKKPESMEEQLKYYAERGRVNDERIRQDITKLTNASNNLHEDVKKDVEGLRKEVKKLDESIIAKADVQSLLTRLDADWSTKLGESKKALADLVSSFEKKLTEAIETRDLKLKEQSTQVQELQTKNKELTETVAKQNEVIGKSTEQVAGFHKEFLEVLGTVQGIHSALKDRKILSENIPFKGSKPDGEPPQAGASTKLEEDPVRWAAFNKRVSKR